MYLVLMSAMAVPPMFHVVPTPTVIKLGLRGGGESRSNKGPHRCSVHDPAACVHARQEHYYNADA